MQLNFTKMHGLGNDFIVLDCTEQPFALSRKTIQQLADRHFGIGCDQLLVLEAANNNESDFYYRIFNADGNEVGQCGNGARCIAQFIQEKALSRKTKLILNTKEGILELQLLENNLVRVNMGVPCFEPAGVPFIAEKRASSYDIVCEHETFSVRVLAIGNPHCILLVKDVAAVDVENIGRQIQSHARFPQSVNVGFMQIVNRDTVRLRVFERGVGETLACGSGAVAAMVAACQEGLVATQVNVNVPGGELMVAWQGQGTAAYLTGPAVTVFTGVMPLVQEN